ncbi:uncharacterized protein PG998_003811 [Apiospora kogelbergensis]|uniref:Uncharacterized protein n=1 Tax=Apiospora kogelbergensis TaxID=1337665 RepID=A0AAW0QNH5_9PEZI
MHGGTPAELVDDWADVSNQQELISEDCHMDSATDFEDTYSLVDGDCLPTPSEDKACGPMSFCSTSSSSSSSSSFSSPPRRLSETTNPFYPFQGLAAAAAAVKAGSQNFNNDINFPGDDYHIDFDLPQEGLPQAYPSHYGTFHDQDSVDLEGRRLRSRQPRDVLGPYEAFSTGVIGILVVVLIWAIVIILMMIIDNLTPLR